MMQEMEGSEIRCYVRSKEESMLVLKHAKIQESDMKSLTQVMYFSETSEANDKYRLMELDSGLLNILEEGQSLTFRGLKDEGAVLCSKDRTFEVKEAETSNSLLLLPSLIWSQEDGCTQRTLQKQEVVGVFHKYLELQPCVPHLHRMHDLLRQNQYRGPELVDQEADVSSTYSFDQLLQLVQASETELHTALREEMACCIDGKWRILSYDYHFRVLSLILGVIDENSWPFDAIDKEEMLLLLTEHVPKEILSSCFNWYMQPSWKADESGKILYEIQENKVSRFLAEMLLHDGKRFKLLDFMTTWQATLPEGVKSSMSHLEGLSIIKKSNDAEFIEYFPETNLPINISERFNILFQAQEKWTYDEICPYIKRLATGNMGVGALLTKYARTSKQNGVKCYTAKHSK